MAGWFERYLEAVGEGALGAAPVGVSRNWLRRRVNPSAIGLPVDKRAWMFDAVAGAVGLGLKALAYASRYGKDEALDDIAEGILYPALAYSAEDITHELVRKSAPQAPSGGWPATTTVARTQAAAVSVVVPRPAAPAPSASGTYDVSYDVE